MSPDLARALHDAVDTGPDDAPFAIDGLAARIRRRRTVRAGVRGGVAVGAAGAVALGATWVGRPAPSVLPAARADAAPGTCGSDIGALAHATDSSVGFLERGRSEDTVIVPQAGGSLGTFVGRHLTLAVATPASGEDLGLPSDVGTAQIQLQSLLGNLALAEQGGDGTPQTDPKYVDALRMQIAALRAQIDAASLVGSVDPATLDLQALVTDGTTVVAVGAESEDASWMMVYGSTAVRTLPLDLATCATPGSPGDVSLPAGEYSVYVTYREGPDDTATAVGPAALSLVDATPVAGLPADVPAGLDFLGDRLVSAQEDGSTGRWVVETVKDADDKVTSASALLGLGTAETHLLGVGEPDTQGPLAGELPGWSVRIAPSTTEDDEPSIVYTLTPLTR